LPASKLGPATLWDNAFTKCLCTCLSDPSLPKFGTYCLQGSECCHASGFGESEAGPLKLVYVNM
jgi:hypothetical protein